MKRINIILAIIIFCLISSCGEIDNNQQEKNKEVEVLNKQIFGLLNNNDSYELDTSVILSNQNLPHLILELETENLESKLTFQEVPKIVRNLLDSLTGKFDIVNPGEDWQVGCVRIGKMIEKKVNDSIIEVTFDNSKLPTRELVYLGTSDNITLMTYYRGGIGKSAHTLIIKHNSQEVFDLWKGSAPYNVKNKIEIIEYLKQNQNKEWGLNTNIIYL